MKEIKYAPVIIPTLCRYEHFKRGIESLKKNAWAKYTDVYIGLDYPLKETHWDGYKKICDYLDTGDFSVFKSFNVFRREENYGPSKNAQGLREHVFQRYDRWISAEDDIVFSPNFLEYMDKCLAEYEDDDNVIAVNGYSYPINWVADKDATVIFQSSTCEAWGIGNWKRKYTLYCDMFRDNYFKKNFDKAYKTGVLKKMITLRKARYIIYCLGGKPNIFYLLSNDVSLGTLVSMTDKYVVTPMFSKTRNYGNDGSGINTSNAIEKNGNHYRSYDYNNQPIDTSDSFTLRPDSVICREENKKLINKFMLDVPKNIIVAKIAIIVYGILGIKGYKVFATKLSNLLRRKNFSYEDLDEYKGD